MRIPKINLLCFVILYLIAVRSPACGPDFPNNLLDRGDAAVLQAPVAEFQRELERMKLVTPRERAVPLVGGQQFSEQSSALEMADLAAALKHEKVDRDLVPVILRAHLDERMKLNAFLKRQEESGETNPPVFPEVAVTPGLPQEFADYFAGAIDWHKKDYGGAYQFWTGLLNLPAAERHYKSTWAAYMLGEYDRALHDDGALDYYEQVRQLVRDGFTDPAGLATASIGREAQIWLGRKEYLKAITLYLQQYAAGDPTAIQSLHVAAANALIETNSSATGLKALALDPLARRVVTAYLIARNPYTDPHEADSEPNARKFYDRTDAWLAAVEAVNVIDVESASSLALAAYQASRMDIAQRWVNRAGNDPVAQWVQAKLFLRKGNVAAAAKLLAKLSHEFPCRFGKPGTESGLARSLHVPTNDDGYLFTPMRQQVLGELGALHLARREYVESLDALLRSGYWMDAAYVAEDVLTTAELQAYVDRSWPLAKAMKTSVKTLDEVQGEIAGETLTPGLDLRWLLARRVARESMAESNYAYYPTNFQESFSACRQELLAGRDERLSPAVRAQNLFAAACMTRTNGMELFGTELAPDWKIYGGDFDGGISVDSRTNENPRALAASPDELQRATRPPATPDVRFHYRYQAADLAWEAAKLMPDNSNETARVLCTAGSWIKYIDPTNADVFYKSLVRRCRKTAIGGQADAIRWFPDLDDGGSPLPYKPRFQPKIFQSKFDFIHMADPTNGWAQHFNSAILATTNGGQSWHEVLCGSTNIYLNATFVDAQTAWVVSDNEAEGTNITVMATSDGGHSWSYNELSQTHPLFAASVSVLDTNELRLMLIPDHGMNSSPGVLFDSQDAGANWRQINSTMHAPFNGDTPDTGDFTNRHTYLTCGGTMSWRDATNGWLLGSMASTTPPFLFQTIDIGETWLLQTLPLPDSLHDGRMVPDRPPQFFPADDTNGVIGATWSLTNPDASDSVLVIYITHDGGYTWQPTTPVKQGVAWQFISPQVGWMWSESPPYNMVSGPVHGTLCRTADAGTTWQPVSSTATGGLAACLTPRDHLVQLDFVDENCGWALIREWNDLPTRLLQTNDGGKIWQALPMKIQ